MSLGKRTSSDREEKDDDDEEDFLKPSKKRFRNPNTKHILAKENPLSKDARRWFDEPSHTYYYLPEGEGKGKKGPRPGKPDSKWVKVSTSTSAVRGKFKKEFPTNIAAKNTAKSMALLVSDKHIEVRAAICEKYDLDELTEYNKPSPGRIETVIKATWKKKAKKARDLGTEMHHEIEDRGNRGIAAMVTIQPYDGPEMHQFMDFIHYMNAKGYCLFRTEVLLVLERLDLGGAIDALFVRKGEPVIDPVTGRRKVVLVDWKRSLKLVPAEFLTGADAERANKPAVWCPPGLLSDFRDTSETEYSLQACMYAEMLEEEEFLTVTHMYVVSFHADMPTTMDKSYHIMPVTMNRGLARAVLAERADQIDPPPNYADISVLAERAAEIVQ